MLLVLVHQALLAAAAVPRLFVQLPTDEMAAAAAPVLPEDVEVVTTASAGELHNMGHTMKFLHGHKVCGTHLLLSFNLV